MQLSVDLPAKRACSSSSCDSSLACRDVLMPISDPPQVDFLPRSDVRWLPDVSSCHCWLIVSTYKADLLERTLSRSDAFHMRSRQSRKPSPAPHSPTVSYPSSRIFPCMCRNSFTNLSLGFLATQAICPQSP